MKIQMVTTKVKATMPFGGEWFETPVLFTSVEEAVEYINNAYPNASEITERLKAKYPHYDDLNRTFFAEIPKYDSDGEWDYSIEYTLEIQELELQGKMK